MFVCIGVTRQRYQYACIVLIKVGNRDRIEHGVRSTNVC